MTSAQITFILHGFVFCTNELHTNSLVVPVELENAQLRTDLCVFEPIPYQYLAGPLPQPGPCPEMLRGYLEMRLFDLIGQLVVLLLLLGTQGIPPLSQYLRYRNRKKMLVFYLKGTEVDCGNRNVNELGHKHVR
jgi:hypothetical protein